MKKLNKFLNAVWRYHKDNSSTAESSTIIRRAFDLLKAGNDQQAEEMARSCEAGREIWKLYAKQEGKK